MTTLMQALIQLSGHPLVHALGWTLLHFCWQGAAVALMLGCVLGLLGGRSSQARYGASCLALGLMVALPAATFARIASDQYKARASILGAGVVMDAGIVVQVGINEPLPPWPERLGLALDHSVPWVLLAWFAGVIVFVSRLNFGLMVARRLKTTGTEPPSPALLQLFERLRTRLGIERAVALLHSAQVQVPTVIGWLRPVVLLPVSCLTGLSPEQIEAVLCHELAHVRRHDYLVSVVQSVIETILFYHPAVWWVSKQVRRERECCCDELAVAVGGDVLAYARALSFLEENRASFPEFVLGANGGVLKMRIKRILGSKRDAAGSPVAALVALGMILAVAGSYFAAVSHAQAQAAREIASAALPTGSVTVTQEGTASPGGQAASALQGIYKSWLEQDVRWIITDSEAQQFKHLTTDADRDKFIEQFWARRNPPGSPENTYRDEHYARIAYSNEHFASNTQVGWKSDRGHIYTVYGKPESIDSHPSGGGPLGYPHEVWHYNYIAGIGDKVDIEFVDTCRCGDYHYVLDLSGHPSVLPDEANGQSGQARTILASRLLAPGGAGAPQSEAPPAAGVVKLGGSISGVIIDPNGALVPRANVKTVNTDTGMTLSTVTDNSGGYTFSPLPPGPYNVEVQAKGFQRQLQENVHVEAGQKTGLNLKLTVSAATQSLTVTGTQQASAQPQWAPPWRPAPPKPTGPQRVSSGVMAGLIISKVNPVYPDEAKAQHIQGVVVLHAHISREGTIKDVQVVSGPPQLMVSSIDAVRQWKYKPYLIDGEPTEVDTTININYTLTRDEPQSNPDSPAHGSPQSSEPDRSAISARLIQTITIAATDAAYPPIAKAAHVQGDVLLRAAVNKAGEVEDLKLISGLPMLVSSAMEAARKWKFSQASVLSNEATPIDAVLIVKFTLDDAAKSRSGNSPPEVIYKVDPEFSAEARQAKIGGVVLVNALVDLQGVTENVHVLRGVGHGLDEKAVEAVNLYRFKPARENGNPVPKEVNIEVNFKIMDSPDDAAATQAPATTSIRISTAPDRDLYDRGINAIADGWYERGRMVLQTLVNTYPNSQYLPRAKLAIEDSLDKQKPAGPIIRSINYKGLNSVTIQQVAERSNREGIGPHVETPYDVAQTARAAAVLRQLLAEHGRPNATITVATQSIPPAAIGIQFNVKEGPKGKATTPATPSVAEASRPALGAPQQYNGVPVRTIGGSVTQPELIYKVDPEFTNEARKAKFMGIVLVNFIVDANGRPQNVHVARGVGMGLDEKAVAAVKKYKFKPATEGGKPVPVALNVEVNFQIF